MAKKNKDGWSWDNLNELMGDSEFRERNGATVAEALSSFTVGGSASERKRQQSTRGRNNRAVGKRLEDELIAVLDFLWIHGHGMVFNTGPAVIHVDAGDIKFKAQGRGKFTPPLNPPDFMGALLGLPVGFDAKVSHSSKTYYATRAKKKKQHEGLLGLAHAADSCGLFGYVIEWEPKKISFNRVINCQDGKVRMRDADIMSTTVEGVLQEWAKATGKTWPEL